MRKMSTMLIVLALMIAIPCLMPFNGFEHTAANEAQTAVSESVHYAANNANANNSHVAVAFVMAAVAAGAAFLGEERKDYNFA